MRSATVTRHDESGQASLEYLLVGIVLIALMGAFAALWRFAASGNMEAMLEANISHAISQLGGICDALLF